MSDDAERLVYINGRLVPHREAVVSVFDVGRLYGVTVYESIRTFRHRFFKLEAHLQRLAASLAYLGLNDQVDMDRIRIPGDGETVERSTSCPSALLMILCVTTTMSPGLTPPACACTCSAIIASIGSPGLISGRPVIGMIEIGATSLT